MSLGRVSGEHLIQGECGQNRTRGANRGNQPGFAMIQRGHRSQNVQSGEDQIDKNTMQKTGLREETIVRNQIGRTPQEYPQKTRNGQNQGNIARKYQKVKVRRIWQKSRRRGHSGKYDVPSANRVCQHSIYRVTTHPGFPHPDPSQAGDIDHLAGERPCLLHRLS